MLLLVLAGVRRVVLPHRACGDDGGARRGREVHLAAGVRGMPCGLLFPSPPLRIRRRRARVRWPRPRFPDPRYVFCKHCSSSTVRASLDMAFVSVLYYNHSFLNHSSDLKVLMEANGFATDPCSMNIERQCSLYDVVAINISFLVAPISYS